MTASAPKIRRQLPNWMIALPVSGASIGEMLITSMTRAISRVASVPV